jgi:hypothetical protein
MCMKVCEKIRGSRSKICVWRKGCGKNAKLLGHGSSTTITSKFSSQRIKEDLISEAFIELDGGE